MILKTLIKTIDNLYWVLFGALFVSHQISPWVLFLACVLLKITLNVILYIVGYSVEVVEV